MPKFSQKSNQTQTDSLVAGNQKNVSFYFSPNQLAVHNAHKAYEARLASYDEDLEFESSDDDSSLSSDDYSSICSDDFIVSEEKWSDIAIYGRKLETALSQLSQEKSRSTHARNFSPVQENIRNYVKGPKWVANAHSERPALYAQRANLNAYLNNVKNSVMRFISAHQQTDTHPTIANEFFKTTTAARLQNTINGVQAHLDSIVAQPAGLRDEDRLRMQLRNISKAILTIKGAFVSESKIIGCTQKTDSTLENDAFVNIIAGMSPEEKVLSLDLYDDFKVEATLNESIDIISVNQQPHRANLYQQRANLVADLNSFQKELKQLPADYQKQKAIAASQNLNVFFGTGKAPLAHRLDAIDRILQTAALVGSQLDLIVTNVENTSHDEKLRGQIQNLKQGILAIKGAVITEFDSIKGSVFASERSSLHTVLNKNYALSDIKPIEKANAITAFKALEAPEVEHTSSMSA